MILRQRPRSGGSRVMNEVRHEGLHRNRDSQQTGCVRFRLSEVRFTALGRTARQLLRSNNSSDRLIDGSEVGRHLVADIIRKASTF